MAIDRRDLLKVGAAAAGSLVLSGCRSVGSQPASDEKAFDVAIVGAGISGLVAARDLRRGGLTNIIVLEARDRVGGRSYNQAPGHGLVADAGPTWIGPGQTAIQDLLRELGIGTLRNYDEGDLVLFMGGQTQRVPGTASPISDEGFVERMDALAQTVPTAAPWQAVKAAEYDAMTYADYLAAQNLSQEDRLSVSIACVLTFGARPEHISFFYVLFYIHSAGSYQLLESMEGGAQQDRIVGGTQAIPLRLAEQLGEAVRLAQPVRQITNWDGADGGPVRLQTQSGVIRARSVILALSPSQATGIDFAPALPVQRQLLMDNWPRSSAAIKIALVYDEPFWRKRGLSGQVLSPDGPFLWSVDVSPADASLGQLMSFSSPGYSMPMTVEQRMSKLIETYALCFGERARHPIGHAQQDWSQEAYTRGCVSPLGPGVLSRYGQSLRPPSGRLVWAGTETAEIWMGYMDGAVRAGHRAALEALHALTTSKVQA